MFPALLYTAAKVAVSKVDCRSYLIGAVAIRSDGAIVQACNSPNVNKKNPKVHAEYKLSKKLDIGAIVYVARVKRFDGSFAMARPCKNCLAVLKKKKVKLIYFTVSDNEWGVINLNGESRKSSQNVWKKRITNIIKSRGVK